MPTDVKARIIQVIEVEHLRGGHAENEPVRPIKSYWDLKGNFLSQFDPLYDMMSDNYQAKPEAYPVAR